MIRCFAEPYVCIFRLFHGSLAHNRYGPRKVGEDMSIRQSERMRVPSWDILLMIFRVFSRRFVWKHIDAIKKDKVILLTTHAMEEADLLADEVAVMKQGELAAFGSPLELKKMYGSALQFSLLVDKSKMIETESFIRNIFEENRDSIVVESPRPGRLL